MSGPGHIILSVIIPTKNRPHLLKNAIASVAVQNCAGFEVCIIDNNNDPVISNQVKDTVAFFEQRYPHISWIYLHSEKAFASGARNDGMAVTKGKYIIFLDDDDELLKDSISLRMEKMMADPSLALLYCAAYSKVYPYPFKMYRYYQYSKQLHQEKLMMMSCSSIMINREIFEAHQLCFNEQQSRMEDYDLCRKVIELDLKVKSIPEPLTLIHLHPETRMSSRHLVSYDFKDVLINRWGDSAAAEVYSYAEGVYIWRKCFGIGQEKYAEILSTLKKDFNRAPTLSFRLKYKMVAFSPMLFLGFYHIAIAVSQRYKNKLAIKADRKLVNSNE